MAIKRIEKLTKDDVAQVKAEDITPRIVAATATMVSRSRLGGPPRAKRLEAAMVAAIEACYAEGKIDPDYIRTKKLEAYEAEKKKMVQEETEPPTQQQQ